MTPSPASSTPVVAVTGRHLPLGQVGGWLEPAVATPIYYVESITRAGGIGAVLLPQEVDVARAADHAHGFAGLMLTGGIDVEPALYGQEPAPQTYGCDRITDEYELALLQAFLDAGKPVLGICRGHQVLNVAFGGTLDQHITDRPGLLLHGIPNGGGAAEVEVEVEPGSRLAEALGGTRARGRCHHHQAVDVVGGGLVVTARAGDGVIEGLEATDHPWVVSVQWHPEDSAERDPQQQSLIDRFVAECRV
ncbi:MAG: putative glutamine amidotransferase [Acidimicrobiales bacterium]|nr:putative glutamine amidotransferase [Acidimicrobiales bacterium]